MPASHTSKTKSKQSGRRRGVETSETRAKLVESARQLILEEGYAAVSARRVAAKAGVKPPLVHYYFPSMDDLFVAVIRLGGELNLTHLNEHLRTGDPLNALWQLNSDKDTSILSMQYLALATHKPAVRAEVKRYAEQLRAMQTSALSEYLNTEGIELDIPPAAAITMITAISQIMQLESALGITDGHEQTTAFMDKALNALASNQKQFLPVR